jgi:hypothetical protein
MIDRIKINEITIVQLSSKHVFLFEFSCQTLICRS